MIALFLLSLVDGTAHAAKRRLALIAPDAELHHQVDIALAAWGIEVTTSDAMPPGAALPHAQLRAEALAAELNADAIAWVAPAGDGAVLLMFDVTTSHVASRVLGVHPPFDEATSAAVALSLKTLLRSSAIAPERERFGARPAPRKPEEPPVWRIDAMTAFRAMRGESAELRAGVGTAVFPRAIGDVLGVGAAVSFGPGAHASTSSFSGMLSDVALSADVRARLPFGGRLTLEPSIGPTLHIFSLDGTALRLSEPVHANRTDPSVDAALTLGVSLGNISLGARVAGGYFLRYQRYFVGDSTALSLSPVFVEAGLGLGVGIF